MPCKQARLGCHNGSDRCCGQAMVNTSAQHGRQASRGDKGAQDHALCPAAEPWLTHRCRWRGWQSKRGRRGQRSPGAAAAGAEKWQKLVGSSGGSSLDGDVQAPVRKRAAAWAGHAGYQRRPQPGVTCSAQNTMLAAQGAAGAWCMGAGLSQGRLSAPLAPKSCRASQAPTSEPQALAACSSGGWDRSIPGG